MTTTPHSTNGRIASSPPAAATVFSFGRHKGERIADTPTEHLEFVAFRATDAPAGERQACQAELQRRGNTRRAAAARQPSSPASPAQPEPQSLVLTVDDMARLLRVSRRTILRQHRAGKLPPCLPGLGPRTLRWSRPVVGAWFNGQEKPDEATRGQMRPQEAR
jgi:Helix-turn-helix domain